MPKRAIKSSESSSPEPKWSERLTPTKRDRPQNKPHWTTPIKSKDEGAVELIETTLLPLQNRAYLIHLESASPEAGLC
jgi:hypothetical protein